MAVTVQTLAIPGPLLLTPQRHGDARGAFIETYNARDFVAAGADAVFVQDNQVWTKDRGVLRGLHFQRPPHAQAKLVRVLRGAIFDVAVDIRPDSATYGHHVAVELTAESGAQIYVPEGFAHAYQTLTPDCEVAYKVSDLYAPECEGGLRWDDPALGIEWPLPAVVNARDAAWPDLGGMERILYRRGF